MDPPLAPPYIPPPFAPPPPSAPPPAAPAEAPVTAPAIAPATAPPATPSVGEAQNHSTHVAANPTPAVAPAHNHPPYAEMIYAAIGALKERDGSSKRAIAKFIEKSFADLPPTHSTLLTQHLKRLKNSGHLVMVKKSYKLPGSGDVSTAPNLPAVTEGSESKRRRGRPPKAKLEVLAAPPAPAGVAEPVLVSQGADGGPVPIPVPVPEDVPAKRGRGRPPKSGVATSRVGRPLKQSIAAMLANGVQNGPKPRGRPRKNAGFVADVASTGEALSVFGKRRGRPPGSGRGKRPAVASLPSRSTGKPMGRPRKNAALGASLAAGSSDEFRRTLEYIQSKIKEAVGVLRPHLTSSISAVDAIQELEAITTMDFAAVPVVGSSAVAPS